MPSSLTAIDLIQENSLATPGLFNHIFSQISDNLGTVNQTVVTAPFLSSSTWASIGLQANSNNSDYIRLVDSSGQRSTYRLGSAAGGTADGLNIYDESGSTMIVSFSKQSVRFFQNLVGPVFDTGGALTSTLNAGTFGTGADSLESRIQAAIVAAAQQSIARVYVPASMYPYSASSVSFINSVQMVREGGDPSTFDVVAYGAAGNGTTNDYAAFKACHDAVPTTGAQIVIPNTATNIFYLGTAWNLTKPVRITGSLPSSNVTTVNTGAVLKFAADKHGIIVCDYITIDETTRAANASNPGANYAILENLAVVSNGGATGLLNGGTGIAVDGIKIRAPGVTLRNVWATSFSRDGVRIRAGVGSGGSTEGNANLWRLEFCYLLTNGANGLYVDGADTNAGVALSVNATGNGGWGIYDSSFLGNTYVACHTDSNTSGPYKTDEATGQNLFLGCYQEGALGKSSLVFPTTVVGGNFAVDATSTTTSTAFIMSGGISHRAPLQAQNLSGAVSIAAGLCLNDTSLTAMTFGSSDDLAGLVCHALTYNSAQSWWHWTNRGFAGNRWMSIPAGQLTSTLRQFAPLFMNGIYLGGDPTALINYTSGSIAPTSGTWARGDVVFNNTPSQLGNVGWICRTAGTPGTWSEFGHIDTTADAPSFTTVSFGGNLPTAPGLRCKSEASLGFYRSAGSSLAMSYGTFDLATGAVRLSMRTLAASSVTASAAKTNVAVNEAVFTVGGASGASLCLMSGGTLYYFNSAGSAAQA